MRPNLQTNLHTGVRSSIGNDEYSLGILSLPRGRRSYDYSRLRHRKRVTGLCERFNQSVRLGRAACQADLTMPFLATNSSLQNSLKVIYWYFNPPITVQFA